MRRVGSIDQDHYLGNGICPAMAEPQLESGFEAGYYVQRQNRVQWWEGILGPGSSSS